MSDVQQRIHATVTGNPVVLYMKGESPSEPRSSCEMLFQSWLS